MRVAQPVGERGSLKWMQRAVAERWPALERPLLDRLRGASAIDWRSPLRDDDHAEYRDAAFLERVGLAALAPRLAAFWPAHGPQWDALAITDADHVVLVEAKAHIAEFCTPASAAREASRIRIEAALRKVAGALGSSRGAWWPELFYQYANRLAHLWLLREAGVDAWLLLIGFVGDAEMDGPSSAESWRAAYAVANHALGLGRRHRLTPHIIHAFPEVRP